MTEIKTIKPAADWELIERHFRAGIQSLREMATDAGVTEGAIRKRAKRDQWPRDLSARIKARADELVRKAEVRTPSTQVSVSTEKQDVEANANQQVVIRLGHRKDIQRSRALFAALMDELEETSGNNELFAQLGELLDRTADEGRPDKLNELYRKVTTLTGRVDNAKKLVELLEKVVRLEREAFGIGAEDCRENPIDAALKQIAEMKRNGIRPA